MTVEPAEPAGPAASDRPRSSSRTPIARFDDHATGRALELGPARAVLAAHAPDEVLPVLRAVQEHVDAGGYAAGMIAYEAASALDPVLTTRAPDRALPLVRFLIADEVREMPAGSRPDSLGPYRVEEWRSETSEDEHARKIQRVREAIAAGDTYQVNLTTRLRGRITGDLLACHLDLLDAQQARYGAYLDLGDRTVLSASPELFLAREGDLLTTRPMKGTAARGGTPAADAEARARLLRSPKERAENVMIADLLRNDLARLATIGGVEVPALLDAEPYPTLWQLTSTVTARQRPGTDLADALRATFPCGSITGAPKASTMGLIRELEDSPRGVYCGAIALLTPRRTTASGELPATWRLSVAIRTVVVDTSPGADGAAEYGVGGGITWASEPRAEAAELRIKARVLDALSGDGRGAPAVSTAGAAVTVPDPANFALLETLAVRGGIPVHLEQHLDRILASADHFAIPAARDRLAALLRTRAAEGGDRVLRLALGLDGTTRITARPLPEAADGPVLLALDDRVRDPDDPAVRHKTTDRDDLAAALERARARDPRVQDVVLRGRDGRVTETGIATLAVRRDGRWWTPPLEDGLLPGVGRRLALETGRIAERPLTPEELRTAEEIAVLSSVRGWRRAELLLET